MPKYSASLCSRPRLSGLSSHSLPSSRTARWYASFVLRLTVPFDWFGTERRCIVRTIRPMLERDLLASVLSTLWWFLSRGCRLSDRIFSVAATVSANKANFRDVGPNAKATGTARKTIFAPPQTAASLNHPHDGAELVRSAQIALTFATCQSTWPGGLCTRTCTPTIRSCAPQDPPCPTDHTCTQDPFSGQFLCTPNCPATTRCAFTAPQQALCLPTCQTDRDCRPEYACNALGFCIPRGQGQIGDLCERDQDCSSAQCRLFPNGRYCTISCEQDCPARFFCRGANPQQGGWCERLCDTDAECPEQGYRCLSLRCELASSSTLPDGSACQNDTQCQSRRCWQHPLFPNGLCARACQAQTDCTGGFLCRSLGSNERLCLPTCSPRSPCLRSTYTCLSVPLLEDAQTARLLPCFADADCPSTQIADVTSFCARDDQQNLCSVGVCIGRGNLRVGSLCAHPLDCETGLCVFPHHPFGALISCQQDRDCPAAMPRCHPSQRRCVGCLSSIDCPVVSPLCREGACTAFGYCASLCSASCPAHTACAKRRDPANSPLPDACLPRCNGTIQCSQGFFCRSYENNPSACHPTAQ